VQIEIKPSLAADELLEALRDADCVVVRQGEQTLEVISPWPLQPFEFEHLSDGEQARIEVDFFLTAWLASRPGVEAAVCG
jgi:hypothetical protein